MPKPVVELLLACAGEADNMGLTHINLTLKNPSTPDKQVSGEFLVDSGASFTVVPHAMVAKLGLKAQFERDFSLADGKTMTRKIGNATVVIEKEEMIVPVVLGEINDQGLLGVTTLESFGLMLDPFQRKIYKSKLMLACCI